MFSINYEENVNATLITADYSDFSGSVEDWRKSYFQLLSWKNTWDVPYELDMCARYDHTPYVRLIVPEDRTDMTVEMMEDLGYVLDVKEVPIKLISPVWDDDIYQMFLVD